MDQIDPYAKLNPNNIQIILKGCEHHLCWEFGIALIVLLITLYLVKPPCFAIWIVAVGSYLVISVLLGLITITAFGVLFSILYLFDRSLAVNLECPGEHKNSKKHQTRKCSD